MNNIISINELWQFFNRSANLFCIAGNDGFLKQINPHMVKLLGHSEEKLLSVPYLNFIHPEDKSRILEQNARLQKDNPATLFRVRVNTHSREYKWISWSATYMDREDHFYLIGHDYTEQYLTEQRMQQEQYTRHQGILEMQEREREELGKELHDNVNQMLATVVLYHQMAISETGKRDEILNKSTEIIKAAINEIRCLSRALVGPDVRQIGLTSCIGELVDILKLSTGLSITFNKRGPIEAVSIPVKFAIFRIVQEQLGNVVKHSGAGKALIELAVTKNKEIILTITDNGRGFAQGKLASGIGLRNIRSRVEAYKGQLDICTTPGKGCRLKVSIPLTAIAQHPIKARP